MDKILRSRIVIVEKINCERLIEFKQGMRFSVWLESEQDYLMPSELKRLDCNYLNREIFEILVLDPMGKISVNCIGEKIYFGTPKKSLCYGVVVQVMVQIR